MQDTKPASPQFRLLYRQARLFLIADYCGFAGSRSHYCASGNG